MEKELKIVNKRLSRVDARAKVLGEAKYTPDMKRKDMLVAKALFPRYPHALIKRLDTTKAKQLEGVVAVMTAKDLPGKNGYGILCQDKPVIAETKVAYEGDPVAIVAAVDEATAKAAIAAIEVEYEVLPAYDDPREAMKKEAVVIHPNHPAAERGNLLNTVYLDKGEVDKAFAEADIVLEAEFETPMVEHCYFEQDICIAEPDLIRGGLTLISPMQAVYACRRVLAPVFGIPQSKIRCVSPIVGGGFGGKEDSALDVAGVAGVLALKTKRTVVFELSREEVFRTTGKRHATYIKHRLAATKDGKITAIDVETVLDKGAYTSMGGVKEPAFAVTMRTAMYAGGAYAIPNARARSYSVFTNHPYGCAFRGFGVPQAVFAIECQIDDLARKLDMDPLEIRRRNMVKDGEQTIFGQVMKESRGLGLDECIRQVEQRMNWGAEQEKGTGIVRKGRGVGVFMYGTGIPLLFEGANCYVSIQLDGTVNVALTSTEMGQGLTTVMMQIAAETMGVRYEDVQVDFSDTAMSPDSGPTVGSRSTTIVGNAVYDGCVQVRDRLLAIAAKELKEDVRDLGIEDRVIYTVGKPEKSMPIALAAKKAFNSQISLAAVGTWYPPQPSFSGKDGQGNPMHAFSFGAHGVEVEVDTETGQVSVTKSVLACDMGRAINPVCVEGQMEGGAAQGIGWAIMEESFMKNGVMENPYFHNFLIPSIKDLPELESIIVEYPNELGPYGAKGIGEPPIIPAAPAIRNAVYDAIGIGINKIPLTPIRVLDAIVKRDSQEVLG